MGTFNLICKYLLPEMRDLADKAKAGADLMSAEAAHYLKEENVQHQVALTYTWD